MNVELLEKKDLIPLIQKIENYQAKIDLIFNLLSQSEDRLLDVGEIVQRLDISRKTFYKMATDGRLTFLVKMGRHWKAKESDVNRYLETITQI